MINDLIKNYELVKTINEVNQKNFRCDIGIWYADSKAMSDVNQLRLKLFYLLIERKHLGK